MNIAADYRSWNDHGKRNRNEYKFDFAVHHPHIKNAPLGDCSKWNIITGIFNLVTVALALFNLDCMRRKAVVLIIGLFFILLPAHSQVNDFNSIDSAKKAALLQEKNDDAYIQTCFYIAGKFIYMNMYDSGQLWLNRIAARLPLRKPSFFSFYVSVFQS